MTESITAELNKMDTERFKRYKDLLDFYNGAQWQGRERRGERRLVFNYARTFVEKITSYLMSGMGFVVEAGDDSAGAAEKAAKAEKLLYRVYEENCLEQMDLETETDCAVLGDACCKVTWNEEQKRIRVTSPDIQGTYAWWLGDDTSRIWRVATRYSLSAEEAGMLPYQPEQSCCALTAHRALHLTSSKAG